MHRAFNIRHRKVGGIWFLRFGRLQFSFCLCKGFAPREQSARSGRTRAGKRTHARTIDDVKYYRQYEGGSTVVVYRDR